MKFRYKEYGSNILRPIIPVEIHHKNLEVPYEVLVDSGADISIFDASIADILGITLVKGIKQQIVGATGFPEDMYLHTIYIKVGKLRSKIEVGFIDMHANSYGIVGQKGFFDIFVVKFDLVKKEVELRTRK